LQALNADLNLRSPSSWRWRAGWLTTAFAQFAILGLGVVSGIASGRLLGPTGRGELAAITLWPLTLAFLASLGMAQSIVFFTGKQRYSISEVWTVAGVIAFIQSIAVLCAGAILLPLLLQHYPAHVRGLSLVFLAATPALILSGYPGNLLQAKGDLLRFNLLRMIAPAVYAIGLLVLLLLHRPSLAAVVWIQAAGYTVTVLSAIWTGHVLLKPKIKWHSSAAADVLKYGCKTHLAGLSSFLNQRVDQLILSLLIPAQDLGLYAVAVTLALSVTFFTSAAGIVTFSRGSNESGEALKQTIAKSFRLSLLWMLLSCSVLFVIAPQLIQAALGSRFSGSALPCRLLLPGMVAWGLNLVLYNGANAMCKPSLPSYAEASGLIATGLGLWLFVPRYGYVGAAIVSSISYTISFVVMLVFANRQMGLRLSSLLFSSPI
jgi:O-antigen/teichoic acid export membrane protein